MSERVWDIHAPNVEARECKYCGAAFYPDHGSNKYCGKHRSPKYTSRVKRGVSDTREMKCKTCGCHFTVEVAKGSTQRSFCDDCKPVKADGPDLIGSRSWVLATKRMNSSYDQTGAFRPAVDIAAQPSSWDDEYAQIEWIFQQDQETVMRDLTIHEVVYANSITEHHQHPFVIQRLLLAIENVSEARLKKEMYWAAQKIREMNGSFHVKTFE